MAIDQFINVSNLFKGKAISGEKQDELFRETLILALSRMTRADMNIEPVEIDAVTDFVKEATGAEISSATIRTAAASELFESAPLDKQLKKIAKHLTSEHRVKIVQGLTHIIGSDGRVAENETELFNSLVSALNLTPAELVGLTST